MLDVVSRASLVPQILRTVWMVHGPVVLLAFLVFITQQTGYSIIDAWYAVVVAVVVLARFLDIWRFAGTTSAGEPAAGVHFWIYSVKLLVSAGGGWLVAHALRLDH